MSFKLVDMRSESSFKAGIEPAGDDKLKASLLILKNQVLYPFAQGFLWALLKDWMIVARLYSSTHGSQFGRILREKIHDYIGPWTQLGVNTSRELVSEKPILDPHQLDISL